MATSLTAYNFVHRLFKEGFFLNLGIYPAVPIKNTGIRITLSAHNQKEDIKALADAIEYHFPKALEETNNNLMKIHQAFGIQTKIKIKADKNSDLYCEEKNTINAIDAKLWNKLMGTQNLLDYEGMLYLESCFSTHKDVTNQFDFYYYTIRDQNDEVILMTFFTFGIWKDDMLATESVSRQLEEIRKSNPMYLTSKILSMGCLFTEGKHYYDQPKHPLAEKALQLLLDVVEEKYNALQADRLILRDFKEDNHWNKSIQNQGYFKINMPDSCILQNKPWSIYEEFADSLSSRSKKHFKKEILAYENHYHVAIKQQLSDEEMKRAHLLYKNVQAHNLAINTFPYTIEIFDNMNTCKNWEFIILSLKTQKELSFVGIMFCYKNATNAYVPELIGMDYNWAKEYHLYRQLLFQTIKRANQLGISNIDFGLSATFEKRKLGASIIPKVAYIQARDNYVLELLNTLQNDHKLR